MSFLWPTRADEYWILAVCAMTNVACAVLGCYLVLRRMSLLGDAISHAVLPGLVVAFIFTGSLNIGVMFVGAFAVGLLTTFLTQALHKQGGVPADAAMGVVFTSLFALGVVLLRRYTEGGVDLDADCVLQGQLVLMPQNQVRMLGQWVPRAAVSIGPVLVANLAFVWLLWKELKITSFDPELATTLGIKSQRIHYLLMAMVAATTVGSFEAVGSILVIAMLIVPAATAQLLSDRLSHVVWIAAGIGLLSAYLGYIGAARFTDTDPAGMMTVAAGSLYLLAVFFAPRHGVASTLARNLQTSLRVVREDLLAMLYRLEELAAGRLIGPREAVHALGGGVLARLALRNLLFRREIDQAAAGLRLTDLGRRRAEHLVRSHRLWEAYLVEWIGLPLDHVHAPAARMEHYIGEQLQKQIAADLSQRQIDPHGREIPAPPAP